ncbi:MAG: hypothetical protein IJC71_06690 [Clostridia bacterium]|nr:hypothetical protein [Clostridia bacterium]
MIMDIHAHTYYSFCGQDDPRVVLDAAVAGGIELFGFCDHNYGIGNRKKEYFDLLSSLRDEYADRIRLLRGIELSTVNNCWLGEDEDISMFDYCLVEHIDQPASCVGMNIFDYSRRLGCRTGIAHTDLISLAERLGEDPVGFLHRFAENGIFWEMNVSCDSVHHWREHPYVLRFLGDKKEQNIVRASGIEVSVGFDGHRVADYSPERVKRMCRLLEELHIPMPVF